MNVNGQMVLVVVSLLIAFVAIPILFRWLKSDQRDTRKRRKNYGKVVSREKRPMVMLSAKTKKNDQ